MKKITFLTIIVLLIGLGITRVSFAASSPTPTQSVTTQIEQQINNLKDKIASKVAELKLVQKEGIVGTVTDASGTQITLKDMNGNIHFIDVDELTNFSSSASKNFGISDVTKNMTIGVLGLYNKESRRILGRYVTVLQFPQYAHGAIAAIDKTNYTLTVVENNGTQLIVEIEDVTKTSAYDPTVGLVRSGFSKLQVGERVSVVGFYDKQNPKELMASRILAFPTLPINPAIGSALPALPSPTQAPSATPTPVKKTTTQR